MVMVGSSFALSISRLRKASAVIRRDGKALPFTRTTKGGRYRYLEAAARSGAAWSGDPTSNVAMGRKQT